MFDRFKCLFGRHVRSKVHAVADRGSSYRSVCAHCGVRMRQDHRRRWKVDRRKVGREPG